MSVKQALQTFKNAAIDLAIEVTIAVLEPRITRAQHLANSIEFAKRHGIPLEHAVAAPSCYTDFYGMGENPTVRIIPKGSNEPYWDERSILGTCQSLNEITINMNYGGVKC